MIAGYNGEFNESHDEDMRMRWMMVFSAGWSVLCATLTAAAADKVPFADIVAADQPVVWWRCEASKDAVTTVAAPSSFAAISGRLIGAVKTGVEGPRPPSFPTFSDDNKAIEFKGDGASLRFADPGDNSPLDFQNGDAPD